MTDRTLTMIGEALQAVATSGTFTAQHIVASAKDLAIEVEGVGPLRFPVKPQVAKKLCGVARHARYGRGEQTLLDRSVRDTWEVPTSLVRIDEERWHGTLSPALTALGTKLGLPEDVGLRAELHSMLVYEQGQFFRRHQDSVKADGMIGSLVVTLPSAFTGGSLVVEHAGKKTKFRASRQSLRFVAFYADCAHEILPVNSGYRITLTYNLFTTGEPTPATSGPEVVALTALLREHFDTPLARARRDRAGEPPSPPNRLVFLLDHEYTARGFGWNVLKGADAARVATLTAAADAARCEALLALTEIRQTHDCEPDDWDHGFYADDEDDFDEFDDYDPEDCTLGEVLASSVRLDHWVSRSATKPKPIVTTVNEDEVCAATPTASLTPYDSEFEGYMGNYGNTMELWYRRAAVVLWPKSRAFAVHAEADPSWAMGFLTQLLDAGDTEQVRDLASALRPFWQTTVTLSAFAKSTDSTALMTDAARIAVELGDAGVAQTLLRPFRVESLVAAHAEPIAALAARHGTSWWKELIAAWTVSRYGSPDPRIRPDRAAWMAEALPQLCARLAAIPHGHAAIHTLLDAVWREPLRSTLESYLAEPQSAWADAPEHLITAVRGILLAADAARDDDITGAVLAALRDPALDALLPALVTVVRTIDTPLPVADALARYCRNRLAELLTHPARADGDWSVELPGACDCELCGHLRRFLTSPRHAVHRWPLAKEHRRHVHSRIEAGGLPVTHTTEKVGRPYTLVLTKTDELFERERRRRSRWRQDLTWLDSTA